jgi:hypothetical protein
MENLNENSLNKKNGKYTTSSFSNGQARCVEHYVNGSILQCTEYYSNGQARYVENYVNGDRHGEFVGYYPNGKVEYLCNYVNGKKHGEHVGYHKNGTVQCLHNYVNGNRHGKSICYYLNGEVDCSNNYVNGRKRGGQKEYRQRVFNNTIIYYKPEHKYWEENGFSRGYNIYSGKLFTGDIFKHGDSIYKITRGNLFYNEDKIIKSTNLLVKLVDWKLQKNDIESVDDTKESINISIYTLDDNGLDNAVKFVPIKGKLTITPMNEAKLTIKWKTLQ